MLSGSSADEYRVVYPRNNTITISSAPILQLPATSIISSRFSSNGMNLLIKFDNPTDGGRMDAFNFNCSRLFMFLGDRNTTCRWDTNDNSTVIVDGLGDDSVVPGMSLHIRNDVNIYAQCPNGCKCSSPRSSSSPVVVLPPLLLDLPVLSISAPSSLGDCQDYRLDFTSCSGSGNINNITNIVII